MSAARYLWSLPLGRFALALVVVGVVGLATHFWMPALTLVGLPKDGV